MKKVCFLFVIFCFLSSGLSYGRMSFGGNSFFMEEAPTLLKDNAFDLNDFPNITKVHLLSMLKYHSRITKISVKHWVYKIPGYIAVGMDGTFDYDYVDIFFNAKKNNNILQDVVFYRSYDSDQKLKSDLSDLNNEMSVFWPRLNDKGYNYLSPNKKGILTVGLKNTDKEIGSKFVAVIWYHYL